jgi:hypothetical protein
MIVEPLELIVKTAFAESKIKLGFSINQMAEAESRLNLALPEALKDYFAVAGKSREMMDADFRLLAPEHLRVEGQYLVFCEENEWPAQWGIKLDDLAKFPNPRVVGRRDNTQKWFGESSKLSAFLLGVGCWQAIMSIQERARCKLPEKQLSKIEKQFEYIGDRSVRLGALRIGFVDRSNSTLATYLFITQTLYVGASVEGAIKELEKHSGLKFDRFELT